MKFLNAVILLILLSGTISAQKREFYEIKIYTLSNAEQEKQVDEYLKTAYIPAMHRMGISKVGVFKPVESDTADFGKRIYVFTPFKSLDQFGSLTDNLLKDKQYLESGKGYVDAIYTTPPFARTESILLRAFGYMPVSESPKLKSPASERVYELRSYESHTEKIHRNKVKMFNEGGEVTLFKDLGFNATFYAEVISGSHMPNLMYMTSFENQGSRDEHWKSFVASPVWKKLSAMPEYQNNVSKINIYLLHPAAYSEY